MELLERFSPPASGWCSSLVLLFAPDTWQRLLHSLTFLLESKWLFMGRAFDVGTIYNKGNTPTSLEKYIKGCRDDIVKTLVGVEMPV